MHFFPQRHLISAIALSALVLAQNAHATEGGGEPQPQAQIDVELARRGRVIGLTQRLVQESAGRREPGFELADLALDGVVEGHRIARGAAVLAAAREVDKRQADRPRRTGVDAVSPRFCSSRATCLLKADGVVPASRDLMLRNATSPSMRTRTDAFCAPLAIDAASLR